MISFIELNHKSEYLRIGKFLTGKIKNVWFKYLFIHWLLLLSFFFLRLWGVWGIGQRVQVKQKKVFTMLIFHWLKSQSTLYTLRFVNFSFFLTLCKVLVISREVILMFCRAFYRKYQITPNYSLTILALFTIVTNYSLFFCTYVQSQEQNSLKYCYPKPWTPNSTYSCQFGNSALKYCYPCFTVLFCFLSFPFSRTNFSYLDSMEMRSSKTAY